MAGLGAEIPAYGVHVLGVDVNAEFLEFLEIGSARELVFVIAEVADVLLGRLVVLILDVADDFLEHVLDGDKAARAAVLIESYGDVLLAGAEFLQERSDGFRLGNEERLPHDRGDGRRLVVRIDEAA